MSDDYVPPALFVTWQDPESRTIFPVGRLARFALPSVGYEFAYLRAAQEAVGRGFTPFLAFPKIDAVYRSAALPPFFENRVMPAGRAEYAGQLSELGLTVSATPEEILARTNGRRATDPYEVFAEFEPSETANEWETRFFVRSLRYLEFPDVVERLSVGERLYCMRDVQNEVDPMALALRTKPSAIVGYCPAYLTDDIGNLLVVPDTVRVTVERINPPPAPLQHRVQCHLRVRTTSAFHAYRSGRFEPISTDALRLAPWARHSRVA
jgi:hypothetical protein